MPYEHVENADTQQASTCLQNEPPPRPIREHNRA
jgi:hypothetical protein